MEDQTTTLSTSYNDTENYTFELSQMRAFLEESSPSSLPSSSSSVSAFETKIDVDELLKGIAGRAEQLKTELGRLAVAGGGDFLLHGSDDVARVKQLKVELRQAADKLVSPQSLYKFENDSQESMMKWKTKMLLTEDLVKALEILAEFQEKCEDFDKEVDSARWLVAAELGDELDKLCGSLSRISSSSSSADTVSASRVAKSCRTQSRTRRSALVAKLEEAFARAVKIRSTNGDDLKSEICISLEVKADTSKGSHAVRLEEIVEAMRLCKTVTVALQDRVAVPFNESFLIMLMTRTDSGKTAYTVNESPAAPNDITTYLRLERKNPNASQTRIQACIETLNSVEMAIRFVWANVLNRDSTLMKSINVYPLISSMLKIALRDAIPETFKELNDYAIVVERVLTFDQELARMGAGCSGERLFDTISDVQASFAKRLRERFAVRVRSAIKSTDLLSSSDRVDHGQEPEFFVGEGDFCVPGEMRISKCAKRVVEIAEEALVESLSAPNEVCAQALIRASRDAFEMFRAVASFLRRKEMETNSRSAMLHRNDCDYLAHHLVLLGLRHRATANKSPVIITVDLAPAFFEEADEIFDAELDLRCKEIELSVRLDDLDQSLNKADAVAKAWRDVLPKSLSQTTDARIGEALAEGVFQAVCRSTVVAGPTEKRGLLKRLIQFGDAVKARGAVGAKKIDGLIQALSPHMSLPLFVDLVETSDFQDWTPESCVALARVLFGKTSTAKELKAFEEKLLFY